MTCARMLAHVGETEREAWHVVLKRERERSRINMVLSVCVRVVCRHIKESRSVSAALSRYCTSLVTESVVAAPDCTETEPRRQTTDRQRLLRAAVLGVPNAGKTTLVNQLLGRKVCIMHLQTLLEHTRLQPLDM